MGSTRESEVVLLDSDSDSGLQHVQKKQKLASNGIAPFRKPFQESDSEPASSPSPAAALYVAAEPLVSPELNDSAASSDLDEISPSDFEKTEDDSSQRAMQRTIYETRKFLKVQGIMMFLEEYLPPTASSEDIIKLIVKLGFLPRNIPPLAEGENLLQLIKLLHLAMKRVRLLRARLEDFWSVDHVVEKLKTAKKILVITGAGISTSLGIPDFRSSKGFYLRIANLGLSDPQEVFDLEIFRTDPAIFYLIAHMILPPDKVYAPLHTFIRLLQDKDKLLRNYTQNIDNLEANAGIKHSKMIQCHGSFAFATCVTCGFKCPGEKLYPSMRNKQIAYCPKCASLRKKLNAREDTFVEESYGVMKPDITFFGEALPLVFHDNITQDLRDCDLIISIGTSLKVAPVAEIVDKVPAGVPQILINRDPIHHCNFDVSFLGHCDDVVSYLCSKLGLEWALPHKDYDELLGDGHNLEAVSTKEKGVYNIKNRQRDAEMASVPPVVMEEPDLVVLEPTI